MAERSVKEEARRVIDSLPDTAGWDDVVYATYIRDVVARGLADVASGRVRTLEEVRAHFGLPA